MTGRQKIFLACSFIVSLGIGHAEAEAKSSLTKEELQAKIAYHQKLETQFRQANQFLSLKHPLSFGNPELHAQKVKELKRLLQELK